MLDKSMHYNWFWRLMANMTGRKLAKKKPQFWGGKGLK